MTISAQAPDRLHTPLHPADRPTLGIDARDSLQDNSFAMLDHRTRTHLIPERSAPAGRYLSIERDGQNLLMPLHRPITHIGRGLIADVRLEDPNVSRRHAILALRGDGARVLDDRSSNGTFVNGREVTVAQLSDGDVLRFGRVVFRYVEVALRREGQPLRRIPLALRARRRERGPGAGADPAPAA